MAFSHNDTSNRNEFERYLSEYIGVHRRSSKQTEWVRDCGQIKCTFEVKIRTLKVSEHVTELITISHDVYSHRTTVTQLKIINGSYSVTQFKNVFQKCNKLILSAELQSQLQNNHSMTQHMTVEYFDLNAFKCKFDVISTFYFHQKITSNKMNKYYREYQCNLQINVSQHQIRRHSFYKSVLLFYGIHLPNDILAIIFNQYYTTVFDSYGEPFICDSLQLDTNTVQKCKNIMRYYEPLQMVYLLPDKYPNKIRKCTVNGLGINIEITKTMFDITSVNNILLEYGLSLSHSTEAIWPANRHSLDKLEKLKKDLGFNMCLINLNVALLLDSDIGETDKFMLWIKRKADYYGNSNNADQLKCEILKKYKWSACSYIENMDYTHILYMDFSDFGFFHPFRIADLGNGKASNNCLNTHLKYRKLRQQKFQGKTFQSKGNVQNRTKYIKKGRKHKYHRW